MRFSVKARERFCHAAITLSLAVLIAHTSLGAGASGQTKRPFEVRDSVEMSQFTDLAAFSPDGRYFVTVTHRGLLPQGVIEGTIWLFETSLARTYINGKHGAIFPPVALARMSAAINGPTYAPDRGKVIMQLTWGKDSKSLVFVGRDRQENRQLFRVFVTDHKITALTPPTQDIVDYGAAGDSIAYLAGPDASSERLWSSNDPDAPDIAVGAGHPLIAMLYPNYGRTNRAMPTEFEVWRVLGANAEPVIDAITHKTMRVLGNYAVTTIAVSADGLRMAMITVADRVPAPWEKYEPVAGAERGFVADPPSTDGSAPPLEARLKDYVRPLQYQVIDLGKGTRRALLAAPVADFQRGNWNRLLTAWSADDRYVAASGTYLPPSDKGGASFVAQPCAVAVIDTHGDDVRCVAGPQTQKSDPVYAIDWVVAGRELVVHSSPPISSEDIPKFYVLDSTDWHLAKSRRGASNVPFVLNIGQGLNQPPALIAKDLLTGRQRMLFDPNPQLANIDLGSVSTFTWKDSHDRTISGQLVKPASFTPGRRYPLVIQTHGIASTRFFSAGGNSETSHAGRPLAGRDILVLQVAEPHEPFFGTWHEGTENGTQVYLSAIDRLVADGLVDATRVGISGYSRTGFYVAKAITEAPARFAASALGSTDVGSLFGYYSFIDYVTPAYAKGAADAMAGALPYGEGLHEWLERAPGFRTDRIRSSVLVSALDPQDLIGMWSLYAPLRDQGKPVELQYIRSGQHNLTKPLQIFAHQEMLVDWFDFWLNGHEDAASSKTEQYERWRKLREARDLSAKRGTH
jgi:hypothetical protein